MTIILDWYYYYYKDLHGVIVHRDRPHDLSVVSVAHQINPRSIFFCYALESQECACCMPAVISPFSFVFFLYQRTKPPQRSVLFINLLGTRLTPRASMEMRLHLMGSSEVVSDEIRMCVHRRHPHTWETQLVFWFTRYHSRPDSEIYFVVLTSFSFDQTFGHWWPFLPESFHCISRSNGSQHSPADRFLPLSEPFLFFSRAKAPFVFSFCTLPPLNKNWHALKKSSQRKVYFLSL